MTLLRKLALPEVRAPLRRNLPRQLAALCWRRVGDVREVLLITSSEGRWILPKGKPMPGKPAAHAALTEAWEEAGVAKGRVTRKRLGKFISTKITPSGDEEAWLTLVFAVQVIDIVDKFPESHRRSRLWLTPEAAAERVREDGLRDLLYRF